MTSTGETFKSDGHAQDLPDTARPIVLFDGACNLCNAAVNFILKHDGRKRFRFASLQSPVAADLLRQHGLSNGPDTVVMIDGDRAYTQSTAVLRIATELDSPWPLAGLAALIPRQLRDDAYAFVARHRAQWFGRQSTCRMPTEDERARFLDG
jgi:predicted DCC family thiol-disulfide oxidoreductase YuxK